MKPFAELTQEEISNLTDEQFSAIPPEEKRSCGDCGWIIGYVNLWCSNEEAIKVRTTRIPGCIKCPYWKKQTRWQKLTLGL